MQHRIIRQPETSKVAGYCDMQLRRMEAAGLFPQRFKLNPEGGPYGAVGWDLIEIEEWIEARRRSRDAAGSGPPVAGGAG
jgi:predicted DNA-binding transcriptional regulator AlpA